MMSQVEHSCVNTNTQMTSRKVTSKFTHTLIQTSLQIRAKCNEQKLHQMIKKISLSIWEICNDELKQMDKGHKKRFFSEYLFVVSSSESSNTIDYYIKQIKQKHLESECKLDRKLLLYLDTPRNLLMFLVIDFDQVSAGKLNMEKSKGLDLSKATTKLIRSYSLIIQSDIEEYCNEYTKAVSLHT